MRHIFMGEINYTRYYISMYYTEFGFVEEKIYNIGEIPKENIDKYRRVRIEKETYKREYKIIKETDNIEEKLHEKDCIRINDEELYIARVVQCDNGDVICYTYKVIKEIEDTDSKKTAEMIEEEIKKRKIEYNKHCQQGKEDKAKAIVLKKKWYQFWKK